ncbi:PRD domain-containing protein [Niallia taxi]|uniref:PRD domain-containing protein n=2 Tax=Bacillati TaxID=1783272 RepID=A0A437K5Y9_9BACI|nr:transcription antiterminator [Niallia taxi]MCM3217571.1 PRD domain-containing protein [Niallia taxi]MDK8642885.1 PRD domain-containing protein [Niallia taxi]MED4054377.1 PRD domain-containing protein [Niallia taxi]MED4120348.1 PRD domain-containing protein [Niallia taxi]RVT58556.1 PRD domain-containing protein [Niallia taxi]
MVISARERLILQFLLEDMKEDVTIKQLADIVNVSERTIHRDLKNIEDVLQAFHLKLQKKAGVGVKVIGAQGDIYQLRVTILKQDFTEYTPDERLIVALCTLLDNKEPIKLFSLANDMGVTTATVSHDLDKLEPIIKRYDLQLVRKRGYGIELEGSEDAKRKAITSLISERFDVPEFLKMVRDNIQKKSTNKIDSISERLLGLVHKEKIILIEGIIEEINEELPYSLADSSYVGLVVHIALAMERIQRGENITLQEDYLRELKSTKEFSFARKIAARLERTFEVTIPDEEIGYITMHLRGAKIRYDKDIGIKDENIEVAVIVQSLIKNVENLLHTRLLDETLSQGLLAHLQPALYRLKQKMRISNPLLSNIKDDYYDLFKVVKKAAELTLPNQDIPEEEIGYLVLHFGAALNSKQLTTKLRVLIICSSGIGTSKMLAAKIGNEIPGLSEIKTASVFEMKNISLDEYDAILSTIPIEDMNRDYFVVSPILTNQELELVKNYLQEKGGQLTEKAEPVNEGVEILSLSFQHFDQLGKQVTVLADLLKDFEVWKAGDADLNKVLQDGLERLLYKGSILDANEVLCSLKNREKIGGLAIPDTTLALYHTRSNKVAYPSFNIIDATTAYELKAMNGGSEKVTRILLLLAPFELTSSTLELLSFISSLIIQSQTSIKLFENGTKDELAHFISNQYLKNYIHTNQEATKCLY